VLHSIKRTRRNIITPPFAGDKLVFFLPEQPINHPISRPTQRLEREAIIRPSMEGPINNLDLNVNASTGVKQN